MVSETFAIIWVRWWFVASAVPSHLSPEPMLTGPSGTSVKFQEFVTTLMDLLHKSHSASDKYPTAPLCSRNVHTCTFLFQVVYCGIFDALWDLWDVTIKMVLVHNFPPLLLWWHQQWLMHSRSGPCNQFPSLITLVAWAAINVDQKLAMCIFLKDESVWFFLTHCSLLMPNGYINLGQLWLR